MFACKLKLIFMPSLCDGKMLAARVLQITFCYGHVEKFHFIMRYSHEVHEMNTVWGGSVCL
jgi:hypothetical protein